MVPSIRRRPHECSSFQFPAQAAWGKGTCVPLIIESKLLALGNPPNSPKQGVLCGVGRTIALKRFRSELLSTFLPSPWQQARRGGIWLLGNSYSCKDNSKLWLQISLFPWEETEYSSRKKKKKKKKPVWQWEKKVAIAFASGSFYCHCFQSPSPNPLAAGSICCFDISICQASMCLCDHRCNSFPNETGISLGVQRMTWA